MAVIPIGANTMQTRIDNSPNESIQPESTSWRRTVRYAVGFLSVVWTGYFVNTTIHRWARYQLMKEYFGPVYPRELESTVHAIKAALDWRIPLIVAFLPWLALSLWLAIRHLKTRSRRDPE